MIAEGLRLSPLLSCPPTSRRADSAGSVAVGINRVRSLDQPTVADETGSKVRRSLARQYARR